MTCPRPTALLSLLLALAACGDKGDEDDADTGCDETDTGEDCGGGDGGGDGSGDGGGSGGGSGSGGDDGGSDVIPLAEAPPQTLDVTVSSSSGTVTEWSVVETDTWTSSYASGVLNINAQSAGPYQLSLIVFDTPAVGASWPLQAFPEGQMPSGATLTWVEPTGEGGVSATGTLTITGWNPTDSPNVILASGTFDAEVVADEPGWSRSLEDGTFEYVRVTTLGR